MKLAVVIVLLALVIASAFSQRAGVTKVPTEGTFRSFAPGNGDGTGCALCVFGLSIVENAVKRGEKDIAKLVQGMCKYIPNKTAEKICETLVRDFGVHFINYLLKKETADWICSKLKVCKTCHLVHGSKYYENTMEDRMRMGLEDANDVQLKARVFGGIIASQLIYSTSTTMNSSFPNIPPKVDLDKDLYGSVHLSHRGADWRGKDCNDLVADIHPGVKENPSSEVDSNCNGVEGKEGDKSFEVEYCQSYPHDRQFVFFGDSATAAFSIPAEWLKFQNLSSIIPALVDELDWPMRAWGSGWADDIDGQSLYLKYRNHNRCAHRQFQNLGKNGAEMINLVEQVGQANLTPQQKPIVATIAYIGNDICEPSLDLMTKPEDYKRQLLAGLDLLDTKIAPNSKVLLLGLADGEVIWDHLYNQPHPLGGDFGVTYEQFYAFMTCNQMNPCVTWLNSDASIRKQATERARQLDDVLVQTVSTNKWKNFDLHYMDFSDLLTEAFEQLGKQGIPIHELIDDVDGFHPSINYGHRLVANIMWDHITEKFPDFFGTPNPNNALIQQRFGDQRGH